MRTYGSRERKSVGAKFLLVTTGIEIRTCWTSGLSLIVSNRTGENDLFVADFHSDESSFSSSSCDDLFLLEKNVVWYQALCAVVFVHKRVGVGCRRIFLATTTVQVTDTGAEALF